MQTTIRCFCRPALIALLILAGCNNQMSQRSGEASPWVEFSSEEGRFLVEVPGKPEVSVREMPTEIGKLKMTLHVVDDKPTGLFFTFSYHDYPPDVLKLLNEAQFHEVLQANLKGVVRPQKGESRKNTKLKLGDSLGQQAEYDLPGDAKGILRVYLVGNRSYQLAVSWPSGLKTGQAEAEKFLDSFKLKK